MCLYRNRTRHRTGTGFEPRLPMLPCEPRTKRRPLRRGTSTASTSGAEQPLLRRWPRRPTRSEDRDRSPESANRRILCDPDHIPSPEGTLEKAFKFGVADTNAEIESALVRATRRTSKLVAASTRLATATHNAEARSLSLVSSMIWAAV